MTTESAEARANRRPPKVSIIGAGMVGATLAYTLIVERLMGEVVLVDINRERAAGEVMDINHALPFSALTRVMDGDYADCRRSDIIVVTAGAAQKAGESRLTLVKRNVDIFRQIVPRLVDVERIVPMPLTPEEREALLRSADVLRAARSGVGLESP